jgi:hypothetical protein
MLLRISLIPLILCVASLAQTVKGANENKSVSDPAGEIVCPKAMGASKVIVQMVVTSAGKVESFKIVSPDGLHLEKDPEVRKAFKSLHFNPAQKDGHPVMVLVNMDIDCVGGLSANH